MGVDVLVIGGSGFVGGRVLVAARARGFSAAYTFAQHPRSWDFQAFRVDFEQDDSAIEDCVRSVQPAGVIYCAVPAVGADAAAHEKVSSRGVQRTAAALPEDCKLVYVSTNAVFNSLTGPYSEGAPYEERDDRYRAYGAMRARGEQAALSIHQNTVVARTSHVEGRDADGDFHWRLGEIVDRLKRGEPVPRFTDRAITPTWVGNLADALVEASRPEFAFRGILHLAGPRVMSDYSYTRLLARGLGVDEGLVRPDRMLPPGSKPRHCLVLDSTFTRSVLSTHLLGIDECIREVLDD